MQPVADEEEEEEDDDGVFGTEEDEMGGLQDALASQRCVHGGANIPHEKHANASCVVERSLLAGWGRLRRCC